MKTLLDGMGQIGFESFDNPNFSNALSELKPELVVVATSSETHRRICGVAGELSYGKGILCEKPLAANIEDCDATVKASEGTALLVGPQLSLTCPRLLCHLNVTTPSRQAGGPCVVGITFRLQS